MLRSSCCALLLGLVGSLAVAACGSDDDKKPSRAEGGEGGVSVGDGGEPARGGSAPTAAGAPGTAGNAAGGAPALSGDCPEPSGEGTTPSQFLSEDETWTAAGSPYLLPNGLSVDAVLTLEPCTIVKVGAGRDISVSGKLVALGELEGTEAARPVTFTRLDDDAWGSIKSNSGGGELELRGAIVQGAGAIPAGTQPHQVGAIVIEGERAEPLAERLTAEGLFVVDSVSQGVVLTNNVAFTNSADSGLFVSDAAGYPLIVGARAVGTVPPGTYTSTTSSAIVIGTAERLGDAGPTEVVLHNYGVPYRVGSDLDVGALEVGTGNGNSASLIIEPGTELRFPLDSGLVVEGPDGTLSASGTESKPIVFTSDSDKPQAGDWLGLNFTGEVTPETALDWVEIAYAGSTNTGTSSFSCGTPPAEVEQETMGAIYLSLEAAPAQSFVTNSILRDSASNGIDRGYTGDKIDFRPTNTFERIAYCLQTEPKPSVGACPAEPECPAE